MLDRLQFLICNPEVEYDGQNCEEQAEHYACGIELSQVSSDLLQSMTSVLDTVRLGHLAARLIEADQRGLLVCIHKPQQPLTPTSFLNRSLGNFEVPWS